MFLKAEVRRDLNNFNVAFGDTLDKIEIDSLLLCLQRTGSSTTTRAIVLAKNIRFRKILPFYPTFYSGIDGVKVYDGSRLCPDGFYPIVNLPLWIRAKRRLRHTPAYFLMYYLLRKDRKVVVLHRDDALTRAVSLYYLQFLPQPEPGSHAHEWWQKSQSIPIDINRLERLVTTVSLSNLLMWDIASEYHHAHHVCHYDLFYGDTETALRELADYLEVDSLDVDVPKMTDAELIPNREELESKFGRTLAERKVWSYYDDIGLRTQLLDTLEQYQRVADLW